MSEGVNKFPAISRSFLSLAAKAVSAQPGG
jgi:hypothetical protein